jgi:hypothetical protein
MGVQPGLFRGLACCPRFVVILKKEKAAMTDGGFRAFALALRRSRRDRRSDPAQRQRSLPRRPTESTVQQQIRP